MRSQAINSSLIHGKLIAHTLYDTPANTGHLSCCVYSTGAKENHCYTVRKNQRVNVLEHFLWVSTK